MASRALDVPTVGGRAAHEIPTLLAQRLSRHGGSVDAIVSGLIGVGLEVEAVEDKAKTLGVFSVARVREAESIPMPIDCACAMSRRRTA